jgi:hypothetical protein
MFSTVPPRDCISCAVVNQKSVVERERDWRESSAVKEEGLAKIGCELLQSIAIKRDCKEGVNKSNPKPVIISHGDVFQGHVICVC